MSRTVIAVACIFGLGVLLEANAVSSEKYATSFSSFVTEVNKNLKKNNQPRNFVFDDNDASNKYVQYTPSLYGDKPSNDENYYPYEGDIPTISDEDMKYFMKHGKLPGSKGDFSGMQPKNKYKDESGSSPNSQKDYSNNKNTYNLGGGSFRDDSKQMSSSTYKPLKSKQKYETYSNNQYKDLFQTLPKASTVDNKKYVQEMFEGIVEHNEEYLKGHKGLIDLSSKQKSKYENTWNPSLPASPPQVVFNQNYLENNLIKDKKPAQGISQNNFGYGDESVNAYKALYEIPAKHKPKSEGAWSHGKPLSPTPVPNKTSSQRQTDYPIKKQKGNQNLATTRGGETYGKASRGVPYPSNNKIKFNYEDGIAPGKGLYTNTKPKPAYEDYSLNDNLKSKYKPDNLYRYNSTSKPKSSSDSYSRQSTPKTKYNYENYYAQRPTPKQKNNYDNSYTPRTTSKPKSSTSKPKFAYETNDLQSILSKPKYEYESAYSTDISTSKPKYNYESSLSQLGSSKQPKFDYEKSKLYQVASKKKYNSENSLSSNDAYKLPGLNNDDLISSDKRQPLFTSYQEPGDWNHKHENELKQNENKKQQKKKKKCQMYNTYAVSEANPSDYTESVTFPHYSKNYKTVQPKQPKEENSKHGEKHIIYYGKDKSPQGHAEFPKYSEISVPYYDVKDDNNNNNRFPSDLMHYAQYEE